MGMEQTDQIEASSHISATQITLHLIWIKSFPILQVCPRNALGVLEEARMNLIQAVFTQNSSVFESETEIEVWICEEFN